MNGKSFSITHYFSWALEKYQQLQQQNSAQDVYRIVDIQHNKAGECFLKIQIIGKAAVFECTPQEIAGNDDMFQYFSKKDIRTITYLATQEIQKPRYKILVQEFSDKVNKTVFRMKKRGETKAIEKTADQISLDKEILTHLDQEDAHRIGYIVAAEQAAQERVEMERLREGLVYTAEKY